MAVKYPAALPLDSGDQTAASHADWLRTVLLSSYEAQWMLYELWGGIDGVLQTGGAGADSLKVVATDPVSMNVVISTGAAQYRNANGEVRFAVVKNEITSAAFSAPISNPRIDLVQWNFSTGTYSIVTGTEAGSPSAPSVSANCIKLGEVYLRVGMSSIKDSDDASNGYITDGRSFVNA